jgi:predicted transcriptional regulator
MARPQEHNKFLVKMKPRKQTVRIQLVVSQEINKLLNSLAEKERRTRSVIAELALQAYAERKATAQTHTSTV